MFRLLNKNRLTRLYSYSINKEEETIWSNMRKLTHIKQRQLHSFSNKTMDEIRSKLYMYIKRNNYKIITIFLFIYY